MPIELLNARLCTTGRRYALLHYVIGPPRKAAKRERRRSILDRFAKE
ncbi:MAG: hypothetical protein ACE5OY_08645 [Candidatus Bathyarchaeia archaeon]